MGKDEGGRRKAEGLFVMEERLQGFDGGGVFGVGVGGAREDGVGDLFEQVGFEGKRLPLRFERTDGEAKGA